MEEVNIQPAEGADPAASGGDNDAGEQSGDEKLYAGKYKTVEDMEKGYLELQKAFSGRTPDPDAAGNEGAADNDNDDAPSLEVSRPEQPPALDFSEYAEEFRKTGALSDESFEALEKKGFSRDTVETYLDGVQARVSRLQSSAFDVVGGKENYQTISEWAGSNLSDDELEAYNAAVASGNPAQIKLAVSGLKSRYQAETGSESTLIGGRGGPTAPAGYQSRAELKRDMGDDKYHTDPAFRAQVEAKLKATKGGIRSLS